MKKLLSLTVVALLASIIFSACNSSYSITKRRYNKGYYVHHSSNKKAEPTTKSNSKAVAQAEPEKIYVLPSATKQDADLNNNATKKVLTAEAPKKASQLSREPSVKNTFPAEFSARNQVQALKKLAQKASADTGDDALSLIWLVVVVLLILYVIGLLLEVGGPAIHVLAVIALVLLILWLLRIL